MNEKLLAMIGPMVREMLGIEPEKVIAVIGMLEKFSGEILARLDRIESRIANLEVNNVAIGSVDKRSAAGTIGDGTTE